MPLGRRPERADREAQELEPCALCQADLDVDAIRCDLCEGAFCSADCHDEVHDLEAEEARDRERPKAPARWYVCTRCGAHAGIGGKDADAAPLTRCFTCGGALKPEPEETEVDITW